LKSGLVGERSLELLVRDSAEPFPLLCLILGNACFAQLVLF
jgi:hypothetical protein